jgi:hypothetical protein
MRSIFDLYARSPLQKVKGMENLLAVRCWSTSSITSPHRYWIDARKRYRRPDSIERRSFCRASILASCKRQSEKQTKRIPNASMMNAKGSPSENTPNAPKRICVAPSTAIRTSVQRGDCPDAAFQSRSRLAKTLPATAASRSASLEISCSRISSTPNDSRNGRTCSGAQILSQLHRLRMHVGAA